MHFAISCGYYYVKLIFDAFLKWYFCLSDFCVDTNFLFPKHSQDWRNNDLRKYLWWTFVRFSSFTSIEVWRLRHVWFPSMPLRLLTLNVSKSWVNSWAEIEMWMIRERRGLYYVTNAALIFLIKFSFHGRTELMKTLVHSWYEFGNRKIKKLFCCCCCLSTFHHVKVKKKVVCSTDFREILLPCKHIFAT